MGMMSSCDFSLFGPSKLLRILVQTVGGESHYFNWALCKNVGLRLDFAVFAWNFQKIDNSFSPLLKTCFMWNEYKYITQGSERQSWFCINALILSVSLLQYSPPTSFQTTLELASPQSLKLFDTEDFPKDPSIQDLHSFLPATVGRVHNPIFSLITSLGFFNSQPSCSLIYSFLDSPIARCGCAFLPHVSVQLAPRLGFKLGGGGLTYHHTFFQISWLFN